MVANYKVLAAHFGAEGYQVSLAFQNHGGKGSTFPQSLFPWSSPPDTDVIPRLANASCDRVVISGIISFVLDNSETLFDEAIADRRMLGTKPAYVTPMFNDDPSFASFLATVVSDALDGRGPIRRLPTTASPFL